MNRKKFITSSLLASAGMLASATLKGQPPFFSSLLNSKPLNKNKALFQEFGVQLWSLKEDFKKDPKSILNQVAQFGYDYVENFEFGQGLLWGMTAKEYKSILESLGLKMHSSHLNIKKDFEKKVEQLAEIGAEYAICPYLGPQDSLDKFKKYADDFNKKGEICKKYGLRFAYHNHDYSFKTMDNVMPQTLMMERTDPKLVDFQLDFYWIVVAGQDPITWMKKYSNRFKLCHVKDLKKNPSKDNSKNSCDLGKGTINFNSILPNAKTNGMKYFIVEQEAFDNSTPLRSIEQNATFMKQYKS